MAWIKENYDRFLLALAALTLLVCAGLLYLNTRNFQETFKDLQGQVVHSTKVPEVDLGLVSAEREKLKDPDLWQMVPLPDGRRLPLFVSIPYIIKTGTDANGAVTQELSDPITDPNPLHPPIPNKWFFDHKLDVLAVDALSDDPDGDGFTNLEEFKNNTDPTDKTSHPPYVVKLFFRRFEQRPFRLVFSARVGQTFQLNPLDLSTSTLFVKVGQMVTGSPYKVIDFREQSELDPSVGIKRDTSVLTLENTETHERIELPKEKEINSPDSIAHLQYTLGTGKEYHLKKNAEFSLPPEDNVKYRLTDVTASEATIQRIGDGKVFKLPLTPASAPAR